VDSLRSMCTGWMRLTWFLCRLDENLMECEWLLAPGPWLRAAYRAVRYCSLRRAVVYKHPLYLREHSKRILRTALFNDSESSSADPLVDQGRLVHCDL
jgi:hypothetical protein